MAAVTGESLKSELDMFDITCEDDFVLDKSKWKTFTIFISLLMFTVVMLLGLDQNSCEIMSS